VLGKSTAERRGIVAGGELELRVAQGIRKRTGEVIRPATRRGRNLSARELAARDVVRARDHPRAAHGLGRHRAAE
jgi:hypothetical protein